VWWKTRLGASCVATPVSTAVTTDPRPTLRAFHESKPEPLPSHRSDGLLKVTFVEEGEVGYCPDKNERKKCETRGAELTGLAMCCCRRRLNAWLNPARPSSMRHGTMTSNSRVTVEEDAGCFFVALTSLL